jgi:uncharacterized protein YciI
MIIQQVSSGRVTYALISKYDLLNRMLGKSMTFRSALHPWGFAMLVGMHFVVIAKDGNDPDALSRRLAVREKHLEGTTPFAASGFLQVGGALLSKEGTMVGSMMVLEADSEEAVWEFLKQDIYSKANVWQSFEIYPFRRAV